MKWPNDADGDVLRRLEGRGFDFCKRYLIDFNIDFGVWPPHLRALALLRTKYPSTVVHETSNGDSGYVHFQVYDVLTYDLVIRIQAEASDLVEPFGGVCNSWGVLH